MSIAQGERHPFWLALVALGFSFGVFTIHLDRDSLALDEGWTMWAIRPATVGDMLHRISGDVHPPLYFLLLDGWAEVAGESVHSVRLLSAYFALLALAATYALGREMFDSWTGLIALILMSTAGFVVYYAREARMYTQFMALAALTTWAYVRWRRTPQRSRMVVYAGLMTMLFYTHYNGVWIILSHGIHALLVCPRRSEWIGVALIGALGFLPWLPSLIGQIQARSVTHFAIRETNWSEIRWLFLLLTHMYWVIPLAPLVLGRAVLRWFLRPEMPVLLLLWIGLSLGIILTVNAYLLPFYQPRYVIGIVPAVEIVLAFGIRHVFWRPVALAFVVTITVLQIVMVGVLWPVKTPWEAAVASVTTVRDPAAPLVTWIDAHSVAAYYDRELGLRRGRVIDLTGQNLDPLQTRDLIVAVADAHSVWVVMSLNTWTTWDIAGALNSTHHVAQRDGISLIGGIDNMIFYRFDRGDSGDLAFRFGDRLAFQGKIGTLQTVNAGEPFCERLTFRALSTFNNEYSAGLHVMDRYHRLVAHYDAGLGPQQQGSAVEFAPCITDLAPGTYSLVVTVYRWATVENIPVFEGPLDSNLYWGEFLVLGGLVVE